MSMAEHPEWLVRIREIHSVVPCIGSGNSCCDTVVVLLETYRPYSNRSVDPNSTYEQWTARIE